MRLFGAVYAALCALALAYVAWRLYGRGAAFIAAALYAIFSSSPEIEGFIVNGELLATLPAILAVAAVLKARRSGRDGWWLYVAGVCAGIALMMKQSSIDSAAAVLCGAVAIAGQRHERLRRLLVVAAGIATVLLLSAAHGALTGWQRYLDAVVLDNLRYRSAESVDSPLSRALTGFKYLWSGDAALVVAAMAGIVPALGHRASDRWLPVPWLAAAGVGVTLGGLYNRHYFVQLLPPLCLLAAAGLVGAARQARREPLARALLVALCTVFGVTVVTQAPYYAAGSALDVSKHLYNWPEYNYQDDLVSFVQTYVPAGAPVYVAFAAPELHYLSGHPSITRYLWRRPLGELPGAYDSVLRAVNSATGGPSCVIIAQDVTREPGDERMRQAILHHYQKVWTRPGMSIYCHARRP